MKKVVNYAIIGYGSIAKNHLMATHQANIHMDLPFTLNVKSIYTRTPKDMPDISIKNENDLQAILNDEEIDFVSICTPNDSHYDILKQCIQSGKKIYCEKPITNSIEKSKEINKLIEKTGTPIGFGLNNRYIPAINQMKNMVSFGEIGDVINFEIKYFHKSYLGQDRVGSWKTNPSNGKGAILDLGVHAIDLANYCFGDIQYVDIKTDIFFPEKTQVDEMAHCKLKMKNNIRGTIDLSRIYANMKDETSVKVYATKGSIKVDLYNPYELKHYDFEKDVLTVKKANPSASWNKYFPTPKGSLGGFQDSHTACIVGFVYKNILGEENNIGVSIQDLVKVEEWIDKA